MDASVAYRDWLAGKSATYQQRVEEAVEASKAVAAADGVEVPTTLEKSPPPPTQYAHRVSEVFST